MLPDGRVWTTTTSTPRVEAPPSGWGAGTCLRHLSWLASLGRTDARFPRSRHRF